MSWEVIRSNLESWITKPESWLVIYAAVVSSIALLWNVSRDLLSLRLRASLTVSLGKIIPGNEDRIFVLVANKSISRALVVTNVVGVYRRLWRTRQCVSWLCHWLHVPAPELRAFAVWNTEPPLPYVILAGHAIPLNCVVGDPAPWLEAKRIGVITAGGSYLWCSRASIRRFREALREYVAQKTTNTSIHQ